jgi:hypothetical protein
VWPLTINSWSYKTQTQRLWKNSFHDRLLIDAKWCNQNKCFKRLANTGFADLDRQKQRLTLQTIKTDE